MFCPSCGKDNPSEASFCLKCGHNLPELAGQPQYASAQPSRTKNKSNAPLAIGLVLSLLILAGLAIVGVVIFNEVQKSNHSRPDSINDANVYSSNRSANVYSPAPVSTDSQPIVNKTFAVGPGHYVYYSFRVSDTAHLSGHFHASGGANDIKVLILDDDGMENFKNNHSSSTYYNSGGYVTAGTIDVNLGAGTYYLVFDNSAALLTNKVVTAEVQIDR